MKILIWFICAYIICGDAIGNFGGDFTMTIEKIDNQPEVTREYADWHISLKRVNRKDKMIEGFYLIKKNIVAPKAVLSTYMLSNNKYYKMAVNEVAPISLCEEYVYKSFIKPYFYGNSTFASPKDCVIHPGYMKLKPTQIKDFDAIAHKVLNKTIYGTYKVESRIVNKDNKLVGAASWIMTAKKKE